MRLQFFPWLFDDKNAWEKSFSDPRYNYELPMDYFMSIYQVERSVDGNAGGRALPFFAAPMMPVQAAQMPMQSFAAAMAAIPVVPEIKKEEPKQVGILNQDEIDALLSGL